ncbi:MAG: helix-hairpin-helix domain-containing protein, partial [Bacteroidota bacterium]
ILFISASFIVGSFAYFLKYQSELVELEKYDYSKQDSLFWSSKNQLESELTNKKKVDYEQELLDFSNDNYSERADYLDHKININNSTIEELILLPGIGQKTAENIIAYRTNNNGFRKISDLKNVPGIGDKKLNKIKNYIIIE